MDAVTAEIREIMGTLFQQIEIDHLSDDTSLREVGVSSLDFVKIVLAIELKYDFEYPAEYMRYEYLDTVLKIADTIGKIKGGQTDESHQ